MNKCVIPGTFDPMHKGHHAIIKRAAKIFDEVTVAVALSENKCPKHSLEERMLIAKNICSNIDNVTIKTFDCLLVDFVKAEGARCVVKGVRNIEDFKYECSMSAINKKLSNDFETLFLMSDPDKINISSTHIRELESLGVDTRFLQ